MMGMSKADMVAMPPPAMSDAVMLVVCKMVVYRDGSDIVVVTATLVRLKNKKESET